MMLIQAHYDYGMRAVKTVITAAGNLKRAEPGNNFSHKQNRTLQYTVVLKTCVSELPLYASILMSTNVLLFIIVFVFHQMRMRWCCC